MSGRGLVAGASLSAAGGVASRGLRGVLSLAGVVGARGPIFGATTSGTGTAGGIVVGGRDGASGADPRSGDGGVVAGTATVASGPAAGGVVRAGNVGIAAGDGCSEEESESLRDKSQMAIAATNAAIPKANMTSVMTGTRFGGRISWLDRRSAAGRGRRSASPP